MMLILEVETLFSMWDSM